MPLTDITIRKAKPGINAKGVETNKAYKMADGGGLYLEVSVTGGKYWRLKYRVNGKEKKLAIGVYPIVSLKQAREKRDEAKRQLSNGIDPSEIKKTIKHTEALDYFEYVANEWYIKHKSNWTETHAQKILNRLKNDVFPWVGTRPVGGITSPELLAVLRRVESRGGVRFCSSSYADLWSNL